MTQDTHSALAELRQLTNRVRSQIDAAHAEIGETRAILRDAIERLIPAFTGRNMRPEDVQIAINEAAFSALQFQDISDQQLAHAQLRLAALRTQLDSFQQGLGVDAAPAASGAQLLALIAGANQHLAKLDVSLVKPVAKPHLGSGDIELFE